MGKIWPIMRIVLALLLFASPALAAGWDHYVNVRFGASLDIPPGFVNDVGEPENGDGLTFHDVARGAQLQVWGSNLALGSFAEESQQRVAWEEEQGFTITYRRSANLDAASPGKSWFAYSGVHDGLIAYAKALASCGGDQMVMFRIEYPEARKAEFDAIVSRLSKSLAAAPTSECPHNGG